LSEKIDVNGENAHPLFRLLKHAAPGVLGTEGIKWNFTKFLVDRAGTVVDRYGSNEPPEKLVNEIGRLLAAT
jgi:glutathione peroxidase